MRSPILNASLRSPFDNPLLRACFRAAERGAAAARSKDSARSGTWADRSHGDRSRSPSRRFVARCRTL